MSFLNEPFLSLRRKSCKSAKRRVLPNETSLCDDFAAAEYIKNIKSRASCFKLLAYFQHCIISLKCFLKKPHHKKLFFLLSLLWGILYAFSLNAAPRTSLESCSQTNSYSIKQPEPFTPLISTDEIQMVFQKRLKIISSSIKGYKRQHIAHRISIKLRRGRVVKINKSFLKKVSQYVFRETLENINLLNYKRYVEHEIWIPPEC